MKKVVMVIAHDGFRDEELLEPKAILEKKGFGVAVASTNLSPAKGMLGAVVKPDMLVESIFVRDFQAHILEMFFTLVIELITPQI